MAFGDYEPYQRCAACDQNVREIDLLSHFETCKAKAEGPVRFFEYAPLVNLHGETRVSPREIDAPDGYISSPTESVQTTSSVAATMAERNSRYGDFKLQAKIGAAIRFAMRCAPGWKKLSPSHRLALDWISDKIARLLCGDPLYPDNWHDIAGYATLGERECLEARA